LSLYGAEDSAPPKAPPPGNIQGTFSPKPPNFSQQCQPSNMPLTSGYNCHNRCQYASDQALKAETAVRIRYPRLPKADIPEQSGNILTQPPQNSAFSGVTLRNAVVTRINRLRIGTQPPQTSDEASKTFRNAKLCLRRAAEDIKAVRALLDLMARTYDRMPRIDSRVSPRGGRIDGLP